MIADAEFQPISLVLRRFLPPVLVLYSLSTLVSTAGMEIFGVIICAITLGIILLEIGGPAEVIWRFQLPVDWALGLLLAVVSVGLWLIAPAGTDRWTALGSARWILAFFMIRLAVAWTWEESTARRLVSIWVALLAVVSVYAITQHFTGIELFRDRGLPLAGDHEGVAYFRATGAFGSPITFAHAMAMAICFPIAFFLTGTFSRGRRHWLMILTAVLGVAALIVSLAPGVWIPALLALIVMGWLAGKKVLSGLGAVALTIGLVLGLAMPTVRPKLVNVLAIEGEATKSRRDVWKANWAIFKDHKVMGIGYDINQDVVGRYYKKLGLSGSQEDHAHNTYLQILAGTGILGLGAFLFFIIYFLVLSVRLWFSLSEDRVFERGFVLAAIGVQVAMHLGGLIDCNFRDAGVSHLFLLVLSGLCAIDATFSGRGGIFIRGSYA